MSRGHRLGQRLRTRLSCSDVIRNGWLDHSIARPAEWISLLSASSCSRLVKLCKGDKHEAISTGAKTVGPNH